MILRIRQERINKDWTQEKVAEQIGITKQAVQQMENNAIKPSYSVLVKLEDLFGMSHRELFAAADGTGQQYDDRKEKK